MSEGPDAWCYDALTARTWGGAGEQVSVLRTLDVVWLYFDDHPMVFDVRIGGVRPVEEVLLGSPTLPAAAENLSAIREHLIAARVPGRSTWIEARVDIVGRGGRPADHPDVARLVHLSWRVDGGDPATHQGPGPGAPSTSAGRGPMSDGALLRVLSTPGRHHIAWSATVQPPDVKWGVMPAAKLELTAEVRLHERTLIELELDVAMMPPVLRRVG